MEKRGAVLTLILLLIVIAAVIVVYAGIWYFRGGTSAFLPGNKYSALLPYAKKLPFRVYAPKYIPAGFSFQEKESRAIHRGANIGIPQFNLLFSGGRGGDSLAFRQFDRMRYKTDILDTEKIPDFEVFFRERLKTALAKREDKNIYMSASGEKKRTVFGDWQYQAAGYFLTDDSLIQVNYSGEKMLAEEELIKIILSSEQFLD